MVDFLGNELRVGDTVVFSKNVYCEIAVAKIHHFGKMKVILDVTHHNGKLYPLSEKDPWERLVSRYPRDLIKLD